MNARTGMNRPASSQRLPPQDLRAEMALLGAILLESSTLNKVLDFLTPQDFYRVSHQYIFSAMLELWEKNEPIDVITLSERLEKRNQLESVGGVAYLVELNDSVPTAAGAVSYGKIVHGKAGLRNLIKVATEIVDDAYEDREDVEMAMDEAERKVFGISEARIRPSFFSTRQIVKDAFSMVEALYSRKTQLTGVPTGFVDLDKLTSGLQPSDLVVVAGRPGMGKTSFCLNIACQAAIVASVPVVIFSLETSKEQLALRMLCSQAKVDSHAVRTGFLKKEDWPPLTNAAGLLSEAPIFIDDSSSLDVIEIRAKARRWWAEHRANQGLVIVDYLQLMRTRGRVEQRYLEISEISRSLKALAKELKIPVIALSQLSRAVENRTPPRPRLADLRESGAIEQDADVVIFLYREGFYDRSKSAEEMGKEGEEALVTVEKQRNGPTGDVKLTFLKKYTRFVNYEGHHPV